jgi:hypothetical protein
MNNNGLLFFALLFCSTFSLAQSKEKTQTAFLNELNTILQISKEYDWNHFMQEVETVKIEKPFAINNDVLSLSITYKISDSITTITMEAPVNKIKSINYDHYLVLGFENDEVTKKQYQRNSTSLAETKKQNYFHIGTPIKDGRKELEKLEKLLEKLLKNYKN